MRFVRAVEHAYVTPLSHAWIGLVLAAVAGHPRCCRGIYATGLICFERLGAALLLIRRRPPARVWRRNPRPSRFGDLTRREGEVLSY
jgi:hypothetical protein